MADRFIFAYQAFASDSDEVRLVSFINNMRGVESWSHPFVGVFFLVSSLDVEDLHKPFAEYFATEGAFILIRSSGAHFTGKFAKPTWDWLEKHGAKLGGTRDLSTDTQ